MNIDSAIETPDDRTIVFHLKEPFAGFDYLAQLTADDAGAGGQGHGSASTATASSPPAPTSSPSSSRASPSSWSATTSGTRAPTTNRKALPDEFDVSLNVNADDIDNRILSGDLDLDIAGTGVQPAALARVLNDPTLKAKTDNPTLARLWYTSINPTVKPFDNIDCRKAVQYAMDRTSYQTAYGGPVAGGDLGHDGAAPADPGLRGVRPLPDRRTTRVTSTRPRSRLEACGQPDGFETNISYRSERPKEKATAEAFQQALAKVGIKVTLKGYPQGDYFSAYAGNPPFVVKNDLGLVRQRLGR